MKLKLQKFFILFLILLGFSCKENEIENSKKSTNLYSSNYEVKTPKKPTRAEDLPTYQRDLELYVNKSIKQIENKPEELSNQIQKMHDFVNHYIRSISDCIAPHYTKAISEDIEHYHKVIKKNQNNSRALTIIWMSLGSRAYSWARISFESCKRIEKENQRQKRIKNEENEGIQAYLSLLDELKKGRYQGHDISWKIPDSEIRIKNLKEYILNENQHKYFKPTEKINDLLLNQFIHNMNCKHFSC